MTPFLPQTTNVHRSTSNFTKLDVIVWFVTFWPSS